MIKEIQQFIKDEAGKCSNAIFNKLMSSKNKPPIIEIVTSSLTAMHTHLSSQHEQEMFKKIQEINIRNRECDNLKRDLVYWKLELSEKNKELSQHEQEIKELKERTYEPWFQTAMSNYMENERKQHEQEIERLKGEIDDLKKNNWITPKTVE